MVIFRKSKEEEEIKNVFEIRVTESIDDDGISTLNFNLWITGDRSYHTGGWRKTGSFANVSGGDRFVLTREDIESMINNKKDVN